MINLYETVRQHPEYFKQLQCKGLLFTQYDCPQQSVIQDLFSAHNYIAYVISGKRTFHLPGETYLMTAGKCVFAKKGAWVAEKEPGVGWCVLVFFIPDSYLRQFVKESRENLSMVVRTALANRQMLELDVNPVTEGFFNSMIPYFDQVPKAPESLLELKFKELLFNLLINPQNNSFLQWVYTLADDSRDPLQRTMEANYTFNLSLDDYASIAGRSLASFKREFKAVYATSPGKWLIQRRLDHASLLLQTSSKNISEITFDSGFENSTHFSRLFKLKFGYTPTEFRKRSVALQ
ncbi:MAG: AraC family transcriptional regulator [Chryseolinea sp.]